MKLLKQIGLVVSVILIVVGFVGGVIINFIPIESSKDISRFGVEWYQFTHYWYLWVIILIGAIGTHFCGWK